MDITIFSKTQGFPLLPLHQDTDSAYAHINEKHAYSGVQKKVDEVPRKRGHTGMVREQKPLSWGLSEALTRVWDQAKRSSLCLTYWKRVVPLHVFMQGAMEMVASISRCLKRR